VVYFNPPTWNIDWLQPACQTLPDNRHLWLRHRQCFQKRLVALVGTRMEYILYARSRAPRLRECELARHSAMLSDANIAPGWCGKSRIDCPGVLVEEFEEFSRRSGMK